MAMTLTFQKETFAAIMHELPDIWSALWLEQSTDKEEVPMEPDWYRYAAMDAAKQLHILTVRHEAHLVGFYMALVMPSLHFRSLLTAYADLYYIYPAYRFGWAGVRMVKEAETMLKMLGVKKSYVMTNSRNPITMLLKRLKYDLVEYAFAKFL